MSRKSYLSDLTDAEWSVLEPLLPAEKPTGSPLFVELREIVNAVLYVSDNGIKWRAMPHDFPANANYLRLVPALDALWGVGAEQSGVESVS